VPADKEHASSVALKLALVPRNPRLVREAELLSRFRNPSIPRLWDAGEWQHPGGDFFPYVAMEWIDGVPLYAWARQQQFSAPTACQMLAQLARALQSIHGQGCVHRDLKGDNVLVRRVDGRAMLIDFGTGLYPEAETLTPPDAYPGTPAYRSPESALFELQGLRTRAKLYRAGPSDELYALGVTACRWLTGEYPRFSEPARDAQGIWRMEAVEVPRALEQVEPVLREPARRLLSVRPEERGTVAQIAEEMERTARPRTHVTGRAAEPAPPAPSPEVKHHGTQERPVEKPSPDSAPPRSRARSVWPQLATAAAGLVVAAWMGSRAIGTLGENFFVRSSGADRADAGTAGLGEAMSATSSAVDAPESCLPFVADEPLPEPLPGQIQPNAKGRCPHRVHVVLNGACWWVPLTPDATDEECEASGGQQFRGRCYVPALPRKHPSTAQPPLKP
jgi:serine/threonine protein kinase